MGLILPQQVEVYLCSQTYKHYKDLGYEIPLKNSIYKHHPNKKVFNPDIPILVNPQDLTKGSKVQVKCICDFCKKEMFSLAWYRYLEITSNGCGKVACKNCTQELIKENNLLKYGVEHTFQVKEFRDKGKKTMIQKYGADNPAHSQICVDKKKKTLIKKYGTDNLSEIEEVKQKRKETTLLHYGVENPTQSKEIMERVKQTNLKNLGVEFPMQNKDVLAKSKQTLYLTGNIETSNQQVYLHNLFGGELNYPIGHCSGDIVFLNEMIDLEYDGSGHFFNYKIGRTTLEEEQQKQLKRNYFIKSKGYKQIHIISDTDKLPSDEVLFQMLEFSRQYFKENPNHSWIEWHIDKGIYCNALNKEGVIFDYGELKALPRKTA